MDSLVHILTKIMGIRLLDNKITLNFYTCFKTHFENDKPTFKTETPYWHKGISGEVNVFDPNNNTTFQIGSVKGCPGISNLITEGIKVKSWEQVKIRIYPNRTVEALPLGNRYTNQPLVQHPPNQYANLYPENATAFKLNSPWLMSCDEPIKFIFLESHYLTNFFRENNLYIAPGFIDFKYQHSLNCHIIAPTDREPYDIEIPYHTPLYTLYPMTDKKVELKYHYISEKEQESMADTLPRCPLRKYYQYIKNIGGKVP